MDQPRGRSFMQVLCEKYSPENFPYRRGPGMGVHVPATPQGSPMKDRLNLPSVLVLNGCGITCAGDENEIAAFCAHVSELDLSDNKLEDWHEVSKIVSNVPHLEFLNLSSNPLNLTVLDRACAGSFAGVRKLVLNNSKTSWETVHTILQELPDLEELFLCLNDYKTVSCSPICCHSLKLLHITDNNLKDWTEIRKLGIMFPSLSTLVLANNYLTTIEDSEDSLARLFPNLRSISLHKSAGLHCWEDIDKLNSFPKLEEVRLLGIPLLQPYTNEERRKLVIARLPSITKLNGSVIVDGEREDSERFFIRYYMDFAQDEVPFRYHELVTKYGKLEKLAVVDLRPQSSAKVEVHFNDQVEEMTIRLDQTVAELKKQLKTLVQLPTSSMLVTYFDHEAPFGPEEMKYNSRALHSYGIRDGDKIYVYSKAK
ncbi:tubulin-specific chaperone cofactor E-like protein isoform X1 [Tiliqua scincoides]|uniref:tubulin-specific chaperone cofactor E-like protein isoform X1 n=1 Tax=Tiliqua scincoides TaxID=71010 RepID=UPI003462C16A